MNAFVRKSTALLLLAALAACAGGGGGSTAGSALPATQHAANRHPGTAPVSYVLTNIVGIGDSLTAGYQSGGFLGALHVPNPLTPGSTIPPGQESGFYADLVEQATGFPVKSMYDPALSPLPLIAGPGLNNQVVSSATTIVGEAKTGNPCEYDSGFNQSAFSLSTWTRTRLNPQSTLIRDLGVPGITLHEARFMTQPLTPTCNALPGTAGLLSAVTNGESGVFYPVLGGFASQLHGNLTEVAAAHSVNPSLVTIWLGANDVLKFMGSGGQFRGGDMTAAQTQADLSPIIGGFVRQNVAVAVANLPDVLLTPYFMNISIPSKAADCKVNQYLYCLLVQFGQQDSAAKITEEVGRAYGLEPAGKCVPASVTTPCGYVTLPGALSIISSLLSTGKVPSLDPDGPGTGLGGNYITPAFAGQIQVVNNNVNAGIEASAQSQGVPLVDVRTFFEGIASGDPSNPYFKAAQINPGVCCALVFLTGGLVSFDGLHPSNTGYALISTIFEKAINSRYGTHIPLTPVKAVYAGKPPYEFPDPYAPQIEGDLRIVRRGSTASIEYLRPRSW